MKSANISWKLLSLSLIFGVAAAGAAQSTSLLQLPPIFQLPPIEDSYPAASIRISTPQEVVKAGSEVRIKITITNPSKQEIYYLFIFRDPLPPYRVDVRDADEQMVPETEHGRELKKEHKEISGSAMTVVLKPGQTWTSDLAISDLYDITHAGKYFVQVQPDERWTIRKNVKSNTLTVTVTP